MEFLKGKHGKNNKVSLGNRAFDVKLKPTVPLVLLRGRLVPESKAIEEADLLGIEYQADTETS